MSTHTNHIEPKYFFDACASGNIDLVKQFLKEGNYEIDIRNEHGWTGLIMACFNERIEIAKFLIDQGADVNATNRKGTTVFMYAKTPIQQKQYETEFLEYLLSQGAMINAIDKKGKSVLDYVTENGYHILAEWLSSQGAETGKGN